VILLKDSGIAPGVCGVGGAHQQPLQFEKRREIDARIPIGRWGTPDDVAATVAWLLSDDARYVTGAIIPVDGGYLAR